MIRRLKKKTKKVDKVIKGLIIGGAIGSVVGGGAYAAKKVKDKKEDSKGLFDIPPAPAKKKPEKKGVFRSIFGGVFTLLFGRKK